MKVQVSVKDICSRSLAVRRRDVAGIVFENPKHKQRQG